MKKTIIKISVLVIAIVLSTGVTFAATKTTNKFKTNKKVVHTVKNSDLVKKIIFGKVTAVQGNTITLSTNRNNSAVYNVDVSSANLKKGDASIKVSDIVIGDQIIVHSSSVISSSDVTADSVIDGLPQFIQKTEKNSARSFAKNSLVFGTVSSVDGNNISVKEQKGKDITSSTITVDSNTKYEGVKNITEIKTGAFITSAIRDGVNTIRVMNLDLLKGSKKINNKKVSSDNATTTPEILSAN